MAARYWEQLAIPEGFPTGSLFGRAGRNIREVRAHTGVSRIDIDTVALTIDIGGATAAAVAAAAAVYRRVFANAAVIANFNRVSPGEATVLLGPALEAGACFVPVPHGDEAAAATDKRSQLYALAPAPPAARLARLAAAQRPAALDATAQLPPFVFESGEDVVAACLAHAMHAALGVVPPYQAIKLRSTLGKQLFGCGGARGGIRSPAVLGALSMADLQELSLGYQKYLQGVFSTGVPAAKVSAMLAHLREVSPQGGLCRRETKC
ncbi:Glyoxalase bleomycin resistance dioxygenase isoform B [Chlorella sorokiniana]|uniref:Glyoxalase bleomycin resistance dioxygenase isoform B n=1 Tax=Chlorella sorokiniana TaxID=3076 RepID=A0A2P6TIM6_CHLSO|nr:Glyoxalase bleomycin resistance dioxygenase isoform B [Chlorella sorokiniana]|eukprot:PRW39095.1 Glyoxalase bleomycin resistance dioxygenase isoform B [Chlorella sorokiniana]